MPHSVTKAKVIDGAIVDPLFRHEAISVESYYWPADYIDTLALSKSVLLQERKMLHTHYQTKCISLINIIRWGLYQSIAEM